MYKFFISVIIVSYQSNKYIGNCIASTKASLTSANLPYEIIVVINDKKNDYKLKGCKVIKNNSNLGFAKAVNIGSKVAKGNWLLVLNPDTFIFRDTFRKIKSSLLLKDIGIIAPKTLNSNGSLQPNILLTPSMVTIFLEQSYLYKLIPAIIRHPESYPEMYRKTRYVEVVRGSFMLINHEAFKIISGFDERFFMYFDDIDLCKRITENGYKILFKHNAVITHFSHQSSGGTMKGDFYVQNLFTFLCKYHSKCYSFFALLVLTVGFLFRTIFWTARTMFTHNKEDKSIGRNKITFYRESINEVFSSKGIIRLVLK